MVAVYKENNKLVQNDDNMQDKLDTNEEYKLNYQSKILTAG